MGDVGVGKSGSQTQVQRFPGREFVSDLVGNFSSGGRRGVIKKKLYAGQNFKPSRKVIHFVHKKLQAYLHSLVCLLTHSVCLGVISCAVE